MNERINDFVGQAKFMAEETINKKISKNAELDAFAEKFAELIVQECAKECEQYAASVLKFSQFGSNAASDCANIIREKFGVE